jgi:pimeloyl-ACP methyl ester carboxylesterase
MAISNIVLVHGGFVDGSGWQGVYDQLTADGYRVAVVKNQTLSWDGDVPATHQILDGLDGSAVLVGHSYGGVVITAAGNHPNVAALAYIAAFAAGKGESVSSLIADPPPGAPVPPILPPNNGFLFLDRDKFAASFAADVPEKLAFMADSQVPWGVDALAGSPTEPTWRTKQSWYLVTTDDHMIPPPAQRAMAERAGATVSETPRQPRRLRLPPGRRRRRHRPGRPGTQRPGLEATALSHPPTATPGRPAATAGRPGRHRPGRLSAVAPELRS